MTTAVASGADQGSDLWYYVAILRRRWWLILSTTVLALAVAWWTVNRKLPEYTAEVLLQQVQDAGSASAFGILRGPEGMGAHLDIIRSAEVLSPVVDSLGLQIRLKNYEDSRSELIGKFQAERNVPQAVYRVARAGTKLSLIRDRDDRVMARASAGEPLEGPGFSLTIGAPDLLDEPVEFLVTNADVAQEALERLLRIEQGTGPNLLWIRITQPDPQFAADIANGVARSYQRHRSTSAREAAGRRREFVAVQLSEMADSLHGAQQAVIDYMDRTLFDPATEGSAVTSELLTIDAELRELQYQERLLSGLVAGLKTSGQNDTALQQVMALGADLVPQGPQLSQRLQDLELRRAELTASRFGRSSEDPQVQVVDSLIVETKSQAKMAAEQSLDLLQNRIRQTQTRYSQLSGRAGALPVRSAEYGRLEQRVQAIQGIFDDLVGRYFEAQIAEEVEVGDIDIVAAAAVPVWPDPSYRNLNLGVGLLAGLLIGLLGALLIDQVDSRIRQPQDAQRATNLEIVGRIPAINSLAAGSATLEFGKDAFRTLRTHLRFASGSGRPQVIAVTSATPRDGKSTVSANLALVLVDQGAKVLLVDADLRRPQIHTTFGIGLDPGISDLLRNMVPFEEACWSVDHPAGTLTIMPSGTPPDQPTELIGSQAFERVIEEARSRYDYVIVDTPPLLAVTDAALVGAVADGTLIVARANKTDSGALRSAVEQLQRLGVPLLGLVLNCVPRGRAAGYSYYPSYYPSYTREGQPVEPERKRPLLRSSRGA
ncbi:MAG: polysaccharide biosynthesis tyrosine autokinase [Candidatus Palauibacterales bacterium]|nr:polysaccharide biosynthesis tyrosine autokinase [Candidatus Palauibacterales bacterium]